MGRSCRQCVARYAGSPGTGGCLGHVDGMRLFDARCGVRGVTYGPPAHETAHRLVLPRSGAYLVRINGREVFVDSATAILTRPGDELRVAHPLGCGDTFTAVHLDDGDGDRWPRAACHFRIDDTTDLHHRILVSACRRGTDALTAGEWLGTLLQRLNPDTGGYGPRRPATAVAHRRLVADTRELLADGRHTAGLTALAAQVNASPHHLSRIFRAVTGQTLTEYRNRMRVRAVLADLQDGEDCLRTLAARYGFADQSHLTRVVRRHLGRPPSTVRSLLR
ncbi:AraC family transcriptional regulator [Actinoplanes philippinensis]|uniref:AraC-type DNA-binding protein n=1 Tax=Actinoplanes philippinensis TaxID=35752 RepID=A0A1I2G7H6_9ACTN|nr:helix-turn-helix transcriptional regulator [Actinoplanes philippinensis]GIE76614.1 AraC family transcriptional regulator [Actinoplanes philippinensis]SFF12561.1 AraC-type DNA-binding protein [Actinoplanes philippinensis]